MVNKPSGKTPEVATSLPGPSLLSFLGRHRSLQLSSDGTVQQAPWSLLKPLQTNFQLSYAQWQARVPPFLGEIITFSRASH